VDAVDMVAAPVHAVVTSRVGGAAIAVLAAADRRLAYRHASLRICEPPGARVVGTADEVAAAAGHYLRALEELAERIVAVTGRPRSRVEDDLSAGRTLTALEAQEYGLIDEIIGKPG
jgi:ATP-dependent Clp protease protease subunit